MVLRDQDHHLDLPIEIINRDGKIYYDIYLESVLFIKFLIRMQVGAKLDRDSI